MKYPPAFANILIVSLICILNISFTFSQVTDVDSAFQVARTLAFSSKYNEATVLCKQILDKSPHYQDVQVLLGRVYFWNNQTDSAVFVLSQSIQQKPYEDAYLALSDIKRWSNTPLEAQQIAEEGLTFFPTSTDLLIRKIKALSDEGNYLKAYSITDSALSIKSDSLEPKKENPELRQLAEAFKRKMSKNVFTLSYDYDYFDKQFKNPWHSLSAAYGRQTAYLGRVTARLTLANRFATNGSQLEVDAYPSLGKKMYAYLNAGYSADAIFPHYRTGITIYRNLPHAFEAGLGIRVLYFSKATVLYVGSIGKYSGNFWLSLRPTFIASDNGKRFSQSYAFVTRYYLKTSFDYITLTVGYGLSTDDRSRETLLQNPDLKSFRLGLAVQKLMRGTNIISLSAGFVNGEYIQGSKDIGNNISAGISYQKMF